MHQMNGDPTEPQSTEAAEPTGADDRERVRRSLDRSTQGRYGMDVTFDLDCDWHSGGFDQANPLAHRCFEVVMPLRFGVGLDRVHGNHDRVDSRCECDTEPERGGGSR